jgi:hypothetical protein
MSILLVEESPMKSCVAWLAVIVLILLPFQSTTALAQDPQVGNGAPEPPAAGVQLVRGEAAPGQAGSSPNLVYHGGPVRNDSTTVAPIFWGSSWGKASFAGDKISGLTTFYTGISDSTYAKTNTEYTDGSGIHVSSTITFGGSLVDISKAPNNANVTSPILAEVCKLHPDALHGLVANGYYPVYVDTPRGHAGFCAWHSAGSCNGTPIEFGFFFNLDGDPGCDPRGNTGTIQGNANSQGLAALANVSGHELSEVLTDPRLNAWYDGSGAENADKCAWTFGTSLLTFSTGGSTSTWKIQGNWSNAAYNINKGYTGKIGCIDGTN